MWNRPGGPACLCSYQHFFFSLDFFSLLQGWGTSGGSTVRRHLTMGTHPEKRVLTCFGGSVNIAGCTCGHLAGTACLMPRRVLSV